jgi:hypothetical protein
MQDSNMIDHKGQTLILGDIVRILSLSKEFIKNFPVDERILIESMVGNFFKIIAVDEYGQACVMREWHDENGQLQTHVIALDPEEMEKV